MGCVISLGDIWRYLSKNLIFGLSDIWRYLAIIWRYLAAGAFTLGPVDYRPGDVVGCRHLSPGAVVRCRRLLPGGWAGVTGVAFWYLALSGLWGSLWTVSKVERSACVRLAFRGLSFWEASVTLYLWFRF